MRAILTMVRLAVTAFNSGVKLAKPLVDTYKVVAGVLACVWTVYKTVVSVLIGWSWFADGR